MSPDGANPPGRRRRTARRVGIGVAGVLTALTLASIGFNRLTDGPPSRPAGLVFADFGGFTTRYLAWGTSGSPIVLIPGAFETADTFAALGAVLGSEHRVYAIDLTGTGYSSANPPYSAQHLADQVLAFLDAERLTGPDAPLLVGHSSGTAVVGLAALRRPAGVRGVVFLDGDALPLGAQGVARWLLPNPFRTSLLRLVLSSGWLIRQVYQSQCGPCCPALTAAGVDTWRRPLRQAAFESEVSYTLKHGIPSMSVAELSELGADAVPKFVMFGMDDPQMSPAQARATASRIGAPAPIALPGRHLAMISSPDQMAAAIDQFAPVRRA